MRRGFNLTITAGAHGTYKHVNRSLGYWRTGRLNLKQFSISFQQEVLLVRELVRNLFSGTEMDICGLVVYV